MRIAVTQHALRACLIHLISEAVRQVRLRTTGQLSVQVGGIASADSSGVHAFVAPESIRNKGWSPRDGGGGHVRGWCRTVDAIHATLSIGFTMNSGTGITAA